MNILLVKPPRAYKSHFPENSESLALGYLASVFRRRVQDVEILDASLEELSLEETVTRISDRSYGFIGITIADPTYIESSCLMIRNLRKRGVKAHITMGGHTPTFHYKEIFSMCHELDSIVMYEGEEAIVELSKALDSHKDWRGIRNLAYQNNGTVKINPPRPLILDLDSLPFPARDYLPFLLENKKGIATTYIARSRGCLYNCGFCSVRAFYDKPSGALQRWRSNENVITEILDLNKEYGIHEIAFADDNFIGGGAKNKARAYDFANRLVESKLKIIFSICERVDNIDEDIFLKLKNVGLRQILLGLESADQKILNYFNKGITPQQIQKSTKILQELGIDVTISFINFTPLTTLKHLKRNIDFFLNLKVNILQGLLNRFQVYGGTPLVNELQSKKLIMGKFPHFSYKAIDSKVDTVFEIAKNSLGLFLTTTFELKKLEKLIRKAFFEAEVRGENKQVIKIRIAKAKYHSLMTQIMEEAAWVFKEIIHLVEKKKTDELNTLRNFTKEIKAVATKMATDWLRMIKLFKTIYLVNSKTKGG